MFLKHKNIIFKIRRSKVTDYAALIVFLLFSQGHSFKHLKCPSFGSKKAFLSINGAVRGREGGHEQVMTPSSQGEYFTPATLMLLFRFGIRGLSPILNSDIPGLS